MKAKEAKEVLGIQEKNKNMKQNKNRNICFGIIILALFLFPDNLLSQVLTKETCQKEETIQRKSDYFFYETLIEKAKGNYAEAFDYLQYCNALDSTNATVLVELGAYYSFLGDNSKSYEYMKKAVEYYPENYDFNIIYAKTCKTLNMDMEVVSVYEKMINKFPDKIELYYELAEAYSNSGELEKAINVLTKLETITGVSDAITMNKFRLYNMMDKRDRIFKEMKQLIAENPSDVRYLMLMGDLYLQDEQYDNALTYFNKVREIDPDYPTLIISMINYYEKTNNRQAADIEISKAVNNPKMEIEMKMQLVTRYIDILLENEKDTKNVNPFFQSLFDQYPNYSQLNLLYGNVLLMQSNPKEAYKQFDIYAITNPTNPVGYEQMLRIALPDSLNQIVDITDRAMRNIPEAPQFYFYAGLAKFMLEDYDAALQMFKNGIENAVFDNPFVEADFYGQIGDLYYQKNDKKQAFENYDKSLALNPQNLHILNNYSYYLSVENKQLEKAEQMSGITVKAEPTNPTFLDTYGWILFKQGSYVMSKIYIQKAIEYSQDEASAEIHEHYGDVLAVTGEIEEAVKQWMKAKELGSKSKTLDQKIEKKEYIEK